MCWRVDPVVVRDRIARIAGGELLADDPRATIVHLQLEPEIQRRDIGFAREGALQGDRLRSIEREIGEAAAERHLARHRRRKIGELAAPREPRQ